MNNSELKEICKDYQIKEKMMSIGVNKLKRQMIVASTNWIPENITLRSRCHMIMHDIDFDNFPTCGICKKHVSYELDQKKYQYNMYCSVKCRSMKPAFSKDIQSKIDSKEWLYHQRITLKRSYDAIGAELGVTCIKKACKKHNIPIIRYNASNPSTQIYLTDKEWLIGEHKDKKRKLDDIANEIGSSSAIISLWLKKHDIIANDSNSYDRPFTKSSKEEHEVIDYVNSLGIVTEVGNRTILEGQEIDILIPSYNIGIEYNGIYSHLYRPIEMNHTARKDHTYHISKTKKAFEKGIELVHIYSDDWIFRKDICKSIISSKLQKNIKIYARETEFRQISTYEKNLFLDENHIQGKDKANIYLGLFHNNSIVACMTFCKSRYNKKYQWELSRFANKKFHNVVGGFSKLLKNFLKLYQGSIISYADRSRSQGNVYEKNGFEMLRINPPSYRYVNLNKSIQRMHRSNFMRKRIAKENDKRTEFEIMTENGYHKIFDCGTIAYVMT